jgi:hypothetical protein
MPLLPLKVSAERFEPYARYRTVSLLVAASLRRTSSTSCVISNGVSLSDSDRRCLVGEYREDGVLAWYLRVSFFQTFRITENAHMPVIFRELLNVN